MNTRVFLKCRDNFEERYFQKKLEGSDVLLLDNWLLADCIVFIRDFRWEVVRDEFLAEIRTIRARCHKIPILVYSEYYEEGFVLSLYVAGIESYGTPPSDPEEIIYRMGRLRRYALSWICYDSELSYQDLSLHEGRLQKPDGSSAKLQQYAFLTLRYLFCYPEQMVPTDDLMAYLFRTLDFYTRRVLDVQIVRIRKHLKGTTTELRRFHGKGFMLCPLDFEDVIPENNHQIFQLS